MKVPIVIQMQPGENGAAALCMMLGYYKRFVSLEEMRKVCVSSRNGTSPAQIARAAEQYGLEAAVESVPASGLPAEALPVMVRWRRRNYAIVTAIRGGNVTVADPASGEYKLTWEKFEKLYAGTVIRLTRGAGFTEGGKREPLFSLIADRIRPLRRPVCILAVLTFLCTGLNLLMTRIQSNFLDNVLDGAENTGVLLLAAYLGALCLYTVFGIVKTFLVNKTSRNTSALSGSRLFKKIFDQPLSFFEQYSAWNLISRLDTNLTLDRSIVTALVPRVVDAVMTVVYLVTLMRIQPVLALACLLIVILSVALTLAIQEKNAVMSRSIVTNGTVVSSSLLNGMNMIETIKSTGSEREFYNMWYDSQARYNRSRIGRYRYSALSAFVFNISQNLLLALQLFLGAFFVTRGEFTLGSMAFFQAILNSLIRAIHNGLDTVDKLQTMRTNIERVNDIEHRASRQSIPLDEETCGTADKLYGSIQVKNLCYRYNPGDRLIVNDVSLTVQPGQMVALVGATGCGKSTLLKMIADLYTPESGEILYAGKRREEIPDVVFRSSVGTVDQETIMFEDTVYNNICMWDSTIENYEVILAARDAQIENRILRDTREYNAQVLENGRNYSGGELQRLELARALAHEPTILLLDEFTSALDALTEDRVMKAIKAKGTTSIIVAHRLSTIVDCDRIYVMQNGRIIQEGTHRELYAQKGLYRELIGDGESDYGTV